MSNAVLTLPPGLGWDSTRDPIWDTVVKTAVSGREYRNANQSYPRWQYNCKFEVLRARTAFPEMQALAGFYNQRQGAFDTWLFNDVDDNAVVLAPFGVGDGTTTQFQLVRSFGGYTEPVWDLNGLPAIYKAGVLQASGYSVSSSGLITFTVAPLAAQALTWTGSYYWRCRFTRDNLSFTQFMRQLWSLRTLEFITVKP